MLKSGAMASLPGLQFETIPRTSNLRGLADAMRVTELLEQDAVDYLEHAADTDRYPIDVQPFQPIIEGLVTDENASPTYSRLASLLPNFIDDADALPLITPENLRKHPLFVGVDPLLLITLLLRERHLGFTRSTLLTWATVCLDGLSRYHNLHPEQLSDDDYNYYIRLARLGLYLFTPITRIYHKSRLLT